MTTSPPGNSSEWQLYRVLQRGNLLQYYDVFIAQGGDDVQQLCEAGEEEFLEIMALVGMASKPLHVRRLQKSLQEWVANPGAFQGPVVPLTTPSSTPPPASITAPATSVRDFPPSFGYTTHSSNPVLSGQAWSPHSGQARTHSPTNTASSSGASPQGDLREDGLSQRLSTSPVPHPILMESQIAALVDSAARLAEKISKHVPPFEMKELNLKKQLNREIQSVMAMTDEDPNRIEMLRKYAAIYGRFDSKRKNDKPMSLHEISVNEASAQLCRHFPALLTRREDLFPLARQVVRDSGYQYSKGHSRASENAAKKPRLDPAFIRVHDTNPKTVKAELDKIQREERMSTIHQDLTNISQSQEDLRVRITSAKDAEDFALIQSLQSELETLTSQQLQLLTEQSEIIRKQRRSDRYQQTKGPRSNNMEFGLDEDATDSSNLPSGSSSPQNDDRDGEFDGELYSNDDPSNQNNPLFNMRKQLFGEQSAPNKSLFDEGLRIAQQYGMADFAEELKVLQKVVPDEDEDDEGGSNADDGEKWNAAVQKNKLSEKKGDKASENINCNLNGKKVKKEVLENGD